jgi:hypothetical protein
MSVAPNEIRQRLYEFEANRRTRRSAWLPLIGCEISALTRRKKLFRIIYRLTLCGACYLDTRDIFQSFGLARLLKVSAKG